MPMFDFVCAACGAKFEDLVRGDTPPVCPRCGAADTTRQLSAPSPLKTGAFPFKPGPPRPMGRGMPSCGASGCGAFS
jgi:putative FmdB family regulatory protein